jgi:KDO2-lipid IV(A) lauroyltransferase
MHTLRRRKEPRAIAMVADQDPVSASVRHFTQFFGHETAFYMGPEAIARAARGPMMFVAMERTGRGRYSVRFEPLVESDRSLPEGGMVEAYARRVEEQIRAHPADWLWAYRRWKVRRNVYGGGVARKDED